MDRAYIDFERLFVLTLSSAFFVVRTKSNVLLQRRYSFPVDHSTGVRSHQTVILSSFESASVYPDPLRRVSYFDAETAAAAGPLFGEAEAKRRLDAMRESITELESALRTLGKGSPWDANTKVSDDFLAPLFENYFKKLGLPNLMAKKNFYELAFLVPLEMIDPEVRQKLDAIVEVATSAEPMDAQFQ